jgi:four helix bundle protein
MTDDKQQNRTYDLEDRLIAFAVKIIVFSESLPASKAGNHLANQLLRSGTSPAMNYGEAQSAESRNDFTHKMKIVLKELRETSITLRITQLAGLIESTSKLPYVLNECRELIAIFAKSIQTAEAQPKMRQPIHK